MSDYNNYLMHRSHKYIKRERVNGQWRYYYPGDNVTNGNNREDKKRLLLRVPDAYKPKKFEPTTYLGKPAYLDERGHAYVGDYETALANKYKMDLKFANAKMESALKETQYNNSIQRRIDDTVKDITSAAKYVSNVGKTTVNRGRNTVANLLDKLEKKIRVD